MKICRGYWVENKRHSWTKEEIDFVKEVYPYYSNADISEMIFEKFGWRPSRHKLYHIKRNYKIPDKVIPNSSHFKKGFTPWNKGKPMSEDVREKVSKTWFKKGQRSLTHRPVGSKRVTVDGYTQIKVADPDVWELYHRVVWEKAHGEKLKEDEVIIFADGNKSNFEIDNLVKISRFSLLYLNRNNMIFEDKDLTKAGVAVSKLHEKMYERRKE